MARRPARAPARVLTARSQRWLDKHPGAANPRSRNYDPNWLQKSRGHKPAEHVERAKREREAGQTNYERSFARAIARSQARRMGADGTQAAEIERRFLLWAREHGHDRVKDFKAEIAARAKLKRTRVRVRRKVGGRVIRIEITPVSGQVEGMQSDFGDFDLPDLPDDLEPWFWFFYH